MKEGFKKLKGYPPVTDREVKTRAAAFRSAMATRRSVCAYDPSDVPLEAIMNCLKAAGAAPSGANMQPWHFVVVTEPKVKHRIREAAEAQERKFYEAKAPDAWLKVLTPLGPGRRSRSLRTPPASSSFSSANTVSTPRESGSPTITPANPPASPPGSSSRPCT